MTEFESQYSHLVTLKGTILNQPLVGSVMIDVELGMEYYGLIPTTMIGRGLRTT
jgi:hypothetical protein